MKRLLSFTLIVLFAFAACKKKTDDPEPEPAPTTTTTTGTTGANPTMDINSLGQVSYSLDGASVYHVGDNVSYISGIGSDSNATTHKKIYISALVRISDGKSMFRINKGSLTPASGNTPSNAEFINFFPVASIPFSADADNGIEIEIKDNNDVLWSTSLGTKDQTGSTFSIVQIRDEQLGFPCVKVYITFSCKVYNANGAMKTITNGKYVGSFGVN